jgi:hypothetical protein
MGTLAVVVAAAWFPLISSSPFASGGALAIVDFLVFWSFLFGV